MEFFTNWFNHNTLHFTVSSSNESGKSESDILKCFCYNLIHYIQCYLPLFPQDAEKLYTDSCHCIDSSFTTLNSKYTKNNGLNPMNKSHHRKLLSIFILDNVFFRLRKLKQKLTSISDEDMLAVKEFIDDISIELPQLLMDNDQKQHLVQYLISPYKNQSKIEIIQGLMNTQYLISRTTMNTATCMQYMELTPLSSKSTDKESHMYFCKDGSITLKLEEEVNPFVTYSSFLMYHQDQNHGDQDPDHGDHDHGNQGKIMHFFSFYSQLFSNSFSFICLLYTSPSPRDGW